MEQTIFFKCLSDPTRLDILLIVIEKENVCVCEFVERLKLSQPKISRHLALLRNLSVLIDKRQGQWVYYRLNPKLPEWAKSILNILSSENRKLSDMKSISTLYSIYCD